MKRYIIIAAALCISLISYSQSKFTIGAFGGYSLPLSSLKGDFPAALSNNTIDFQNSSSYLTKRGFNLGANFKYTVDSAGNNKLTLGVGYNQFGQKNDYTTTNGTKSISNKMGIFSISAGLEYDFRPKKKFNPYAGIELAANFFSGDIQFTGDTLFTFDRKSESRYGIILNAGAEYKAGKNLALVAGLKYVMSNLIGKTGGAVSTATSDGNTDTGTTGTTLSAEIPLNDIDSRTSLTKSIISLQFYVGVSYNFGILNNR